MLGNMIDELIAEDEAEVILEPHREALGSFLRLAWQDWHGMVRASPVLALSRPPTRPNIVYDLISNRAESYFDGLRFLRPARAAF